MTTKQRLAQLEKQKPVEPIRREMSEADNKAWERCMNSFADALGVTRAEVNKALENIGNDK